MLAPVYDLTGPTRAHARAQAAQDNHFMHARAGGASAAPGGSITQRVLREFAALHHELTEVPLSLRQCQHRNFWAPTCDCPSAAA